MFFNKKGEPETIFSALSHEDILRGWEWKGNRLDDETISKLKEESAAFSQSLLWKILKSEVQWIAVKTLMEKGHTADDIRAAQLLGYFTKVVDDKLTSMTS